MDKLLAPIVVLSLTLALPTAAAVIHVPADYPTIQAGIDAAVDGDVVLVADGLYTGSGNRDLDLQGKAITVRSEGGPAGCVIDCGGSEAEPYRGFLFHSGEGRATLLEGFTIRSGWSDQGGGIACLAGSGPTIRGNVITGNRADNYNGGGGIYCEESDPLIQANVIRANSAEFPDHLGFGGGISCYACSPEIIGNTIKGNLAEFGGGGIICLDASPLIQGNVIAGNTLDCVETNPPSGGAGICHLDSPYTPSSPSEIIDNLILGNVASGSAQAYCVGGGIYVYTSYPWLNGGAAPRPMRVGSGQLGEIAAGRTVSDRLRQPRRDFPQCFPEAAPVIRGNTIDGNAAQWSGGGISSCLSSPVIADNRITRNRAADGGGIYILSGLSGSITGNMISGNEAEEHGGGIECQSTGLLIENNLVSGNEAAYGGGMRIIWGGGPPIGSNTITGNRAINGGGILLDDATLEIGNTILFGNLADSGDEIYIGPRYSQSTLTIGYCDVRGGQTAVHAEPGCNLVWGAGMIVADPLFARGPRGDYYLGQTAAGQVEDSPCIDAGNPASAVGEGTTRTDGAQDEGILDLGFHYPLGMGGASCLVTGPGPAQGNPPRVRMFLAEQDAPLLSEINAFVSPHFGANVSCADLTGDGLDELLAGAGPGDFIVPHVRGFRPDGSPLPGLSFLAYGIRRYGVNVAAADLDGDGFAEIVTGPGPGAVCGPHVRGWNYDGSAAVAPILGVSFLAYGTRQWGVNVAGGDLDGDGFAEIVTGPGPGTLFGPHVRGWNVDGGTAAPMPNVSFLAYGTLRYGVVVACGDVDGDGIAEIVTAPGPSPAFGAQVRGWNCDGGSVSLVPGLDFFAWPPAAARYGARVFAGADLDGDGRAEVVVGAGPDPAAGSSVKVFRYDGAAVSEWLSFQAYPDGWTHGVNVAAGRFDGGAEGDWARPYAPRPPPESARTATEPRRP